MEYGRLLLHIILTIIFYIFFGNESIEKFNNKGVSITKFEETVVDVPPPGNKKLLLVKTLFKDTYVRNWCC